MATQRSYRSIKRFAEAYSQICDSDTTLRCFSSGSPITRIAANDGLKAIEVYNTFPLTIRKRMGFTPEKVEGLENRCKKELGQE